MNIFQLKLKKEKGFTIIEALVFLFIFVVTVLSFYQAFALGTAYILETKYRLGATQVGNEKMEIIRSLEYTKIGTKRPDGAGGWLYGIPRGDLLQEEEISKNLKKYYVKTSVKYIDDPFDKLATDAVGKDTRPADYKMVEVQISWDPDYSENKSVFLVSTFVPPGVEAIATGGILSVNIHDSSGTSISAADVRLVNTVTDIDQTNPTESGNTMFFEVPQDLTSNYHIQVSKEGYFSMQTYPAYNPLVAGSFDPVYKNISVTNGNLWQVSITIDKSSELTVHTRDMLGNNVPNVAFALEGGVKIGTNKTTTLPIYSYKNNLNSGAGGDINVTDTSEISSGTYTAVVASPPTDYKFVKMSSATLKVNSFYLNPDASLEETMLFANTQTNSLLLTVKNQATGNPIAGATVQLKNTLLGYDVTLTSDAFGMVFFPNDSTPLNAVIYEATVSASGFSNKIENITINKLTEKIINLGT